MINDQKMSGDAQEDLPARIEQEYREKYEAGLSDAAPPKELFEEAVQELTELRIEYEELQMVMTEYETEFEECKTDLEKRVQEGDLRAAKLEIKLAKTESDKTEYKKDATTSENQVEKLQKELQKTVDRGSNNNKRVVQLEIENEELQNEARHLGYIINDLELKFDTQLEEIELLQNELEEQKLHSEEQIERQKQQLMEITGDLQVRERELKVLKLKTIFDSPTRVEKKQTLGGSFVASSARAAFLGRSITKTSEDLSKLPILELLPGTGRNEGLKRGDNTMKHRRFNSNLSTGLAQDFNDQVEKSSRRKTVGFIDANQSDLMINSQHAVNLDQDSKRQDAATSGVIVIDDVESKQSQSLFDRAPEEIDLQKSHEQLSLAELRKSIGETGSRKNTASPHRDSKPSTFHPKPATEQEELDVKDQSAPEPANIEKESKQLLTFEDQEADFMSTGRSQSMQKVSRDKKRNSKKPCDDKRSKLQPFDLSQNLMKMNDLDFEELLECAEDHIESSAFFASSVQLMGIIDSTINAIDERLTKKKSRILNLPSTKNKNAATLDPHHQSHLMTPRGVNCH